MSQEDTQEPSSPTPTPMNTDSVDLSDGEDYTSKKDEPAKKQKKGRLRRFIDDEAGEERTKKSKKSKKNDSDDDDDEPAARSDDGSDDGADLEGFVVSDSEVPDKSSKKHKQADRVYELKDDNEDEAHVQSVKERERLRQLEKEVLELRKIKQKDEERKAEKDKKAELVGRMTKNMETSAAGAVSTTNKKRKKDDSDNETDDDSKETQSLASVITNKNKKNKTGQEDYKVPPSRATEADVKKAAAAPKKNDVPLDSAKKSNATNGTGATAKTKKPAVGDCFKYKDKLYLLTHYEETTGKSRGADESDEKWIHKHPLNQLSTCLRVKSAPSEAWHKLFRKILESIPNEPLTFCIDDDKTLPLGLRHTDDDIENRLFFCVIPNSGSPVVMTEDERTWETQWNKDKSAGKPKLEFREYDSKVSGAGKKGKGKAIRKPWHVCNITTNVYDDSGVYYAKLILHPGLANSRYDAVLKRRKAAQAKKDDGGGKDSDDDDDASGDEDDEKEEKKPEKKPAKSAPPSTPALKPVSTGLDGEQLGKMLKDFVEKGMSDNTASMNKGLKNIGDVLFEIRKRLDKLEEDQADLRTFISDQIKRATLPASITLSPLPTKAEQAVAEMQKTAEQVDEAVQKMTEDMKDELDLGDE